MYRNLISRIGAPPGGQTASAYHQVQREAFNAFGSSWEVEHGPESRHRKAYRNRLRYLQNACRARVGAHVLDVGCGTGLYLRALGDLIASGTGIDLSTQMIAEARARTATGVLASRLRFEVLAAEAVDPKTIEPCDIALFVGSLEHMQDPVVALERVSRVVVPGGTIIIIMRHPWHPPALIGSALRRPADIPPHRHLTPGAIALAASNIGWRLAALTSLGSRITEARRLPRHARIGRRAIDGLIGVISGAFIAELQRLDR